MLPNAFIGKARKPTEAELALELGPSKELWDRVITELAEENGVNEQEWSSYSPKAGWSLRLKRKKRTIVWLGPRHGCFLAAFILGDKAVKAARESEIDRRMKKILADAPRYAEGTGIRLEIKKQKDLSIIKHLAAIKIDN